MDVLSEARRRQVFRAAAWYGGLAWLAVEVADTVFPRFGLPDWSVRAVIAAALLGLPVALALAWWFDLSVLGLRRESPAPAQPQHDEHAAGVAAPAAPLWRLPSFWIALALGVGLGLSVQQAWQRLVRPAWGDRPGLAVLPFANLSPDPEDAYFADGLHEEILATLARAGGLRLISRTSVQEYRDPRRNLREIADALDVSLILEGSVRRAGDDLRLTVQLIDGRTDEHLWAETYDRRFEDALQLQRTVALRVVSEMGGRLSPNERRLLDVSAPSVPAAYDRYLHALALSAGARASPEIEGLLTEAIEFDPGFALAHALRSKVRTTLFQTASPADQARLANGARADFERALALQRDLPSALVARAHYELWVVPDPDSSPGAALEDLVRALEIAPNDADTHAVAATTLRRLGRFDEAIAHFEQASVLTPGAPAYDMEIFHTLLMLGRLDDADTALQTFAARHPAERWPELAGFFLRFLRSGATSGWREAHDRLAPRIEDWLRPQMTRTMLVCTGDLAGLVELHTGPAADMVPGYADFELGVIHTALGDPSRARPRLSAAAAAARKSNDAFARVEGAIALALLGEPEAALREADEAVGLLPESRDIVNGPSIALSRAWVLIATRHRAAEGYAELERLLGAWGLWPRWVAARPEWRLLRTDAQVQQIIRDKLAGDRSAVVRPHVSD